MSRAIRAVLIKLAVSLAVIAGTIPLVFSDIAHELAVVLAAFIVVVFIPVAISYCIDAHREIRADAAAQANRKMKILGIVLGVPEVILGFVLMVAGICGPINMLTSDSVNTVFHKSYIFELAILFIGACYLVIGYHYIKEGLGLGPSLKISLAARKQRKF